VRTNDTSAPCDRPSSARAVHRPVTARRVAAAIWFLLAFLTGAAGINDLFERDVPGLILGAALAPTSAWIGYRVLRSLSRDIAVVAACVAAFFALIVVVAVAQGNLSAFPTGVIALGLTAVAGIVPLRARPARRTEAVG
jgi:hypothetical protein